MRKLTILAVVVTLICGAVIVIVPALCQQGSDGGSCDLVSAVRGSIRLVNSEVCQGQNAPAPCAVTDVAGLERK